MALAGAPSISVKNNGGQKISYSPSSTFIKFKPSMMGISLDKSAKCGR